MQSETEILDYLKTMKFKRSLFGVDRSDVLEKIRTLNLMYQKQQEKTGEQEVASAQYEKKVEALVKAFVNIQEQADGILGQAKKQAEEMTETAKKESTEIVEQAQKESAEILGQAQKESAEILDRAKKSSEQLLAQQKQEIAQLTEKRNGLLMDLKRMADVLNQLVR